MTIEEILKEQEEELASLVCLDNDSLNEVLSIVEIYNTKIIKAVCKDMTRINNEKKNKEIWGNKRDDWEQRFDERFPQFCSGYVYRVKDIKDFIREERECLIKETVSETIKIILDWDILKLIFWFKDKNGFKKAFENHKKLTE